jgi:hypothetical protein
LFKTHDALAHQLVMRSLRVMRYEVMYVMNMLIEQICMRAVIGNNVRAWLNIGVSEGIARSIP